MGLYLSHETECDMPQCFRLDYHNELTSRYQGHSRSSEANGCSSSPVSLSEAQPFNSGLGRLYADRKKLDTNTNTHTHSR
jgi:hypothetical protein